MNKLLLTVVALGFVTSAAQAADTVCSGDVSCLKPKVKVYLETELKSTTSALRQQYTQIATSGDHYQCYHESEDPVAEALANPDIELMNAGASDEIDDNYGDDPARFFTNRFVASVALPFDCNEGSNVHNWNPRLLILVTVTDESQPMDGHQPFAIQVEKILNQ